MTETPETFSNRHIELVTFEKVDEYSVAIRGGANFSLTEEVKGKLKVDEPYLLECIGGTGLGSQLVGIATYDAAVYRPEPYGKGTMVPIPREWFYRRSDQWLRKRDQEFKDKREQEARDLLERNREDWLNRQEALPEPLKARLLRFHTAGGENFKIHGWGYELVCSELVVLYAESGGELTDKIKAYDEEQGCSGHQHDFAQMVAKLLTGEQKGDASQVIAALTPITGDPDYSKKR